jgi:hypothetical protein
LEFQKKGGRNMGNENKTSAVQQLKTAAGKTNGLKTAQLNIENGKPVLMNSQSTTGNNEVSTSTGNYTTSSSTGSVSQSSGTVTTDDSKGSQ